MVRIDQLSFGYKSRQSLFKDLSLTLEPGNIYGLLGRNGAGKTTLLKIMAGLQFPKSGGVEIFGFTPAQRHPAFLGDLCFLPEDLYVPKTSIKKFLAMHAPFYPRFSMETMDFYLKEFDLDQNWKMDALSYGQKKKVLLGFALSTNAKLVLLDEPTNGLDIPSKSQFRSLMSSAVADDRIIIISTHQVRDMASLIDPIIVLENGEIIFNRDLQSISEKVYFELIPSIQPPADVLYSERVPGGYLAIRANDKGWDSEVDIEVLFNALIHHRDQLQQLFQPTLVA